MDLFLVFLGFENVDNLNLQNKLKNYLPMEWDFPSKMQVQDKNYPTFLLYVQNNADNFT